MKRFVILEHRWNGVHWDFMLELDDCMRTWAIDEPIVAGSRLPARSLPDHRLSYLHYEGEVSGGRGYVSRVDQGLYEPITWSSDTVTIRLLGDRTRGKVRISRLRDQSDGGLDAWEFSFEEGNFD